MPDKEWRGLVGLFRKDEGVRSAASTAEPKVSEKEELEMSSELFEKGNVGKSVMDEAVNVVKEVFHHQQWNFAEVISTPELVAYELGFTFGSCRLRVRVCIEATPLVCRIDAIYPFSADPLYSYLLCKAMVHENFPRRFGAIQYDEGDGEIANRYSFLISHGLNEKDFLAVFWAVTKSAADSYETIMKNSVGKFKSSERIEIVARLNDLIRDLNDF